jgi:hypothetical protein
MRPSSTAITSSSPKLEISHFVFWRAILTFMDPNPGLVSSPTRIQSLACLNLCGTGTRYLLYEDTNPGEAGAARNCIRIRRIHMFLGLSDPELDPLVREPDPYPSIIKQKKIKIKLGFLLFCDFFLTFYL